MGIYRHKLFGCFVGLLAFTHVVLAQNSHLGSSLPYDLKTTTADGIPTPPATFSPKETTAFLPQIPKVNVITGEYCEEECDLQVAGIEPLSINRFYNHLTGISHPLCGHWRLNPETYMLFNFEAIEGCQTFVALGERNSSFFVYERPTQNGFQIDGSKSKIFTNSSSPYSGQGHPLNTKVQYNKGHFVRNYRHNVYFPADYYWWEGKITDGSGGIRFFRTDSRQWPQEGKRWPCRRRRHPASGELMEEPLEFVPPFQGQITEERKPNGNIIRYEYEDINAPSNFIDHDLPTTYVLKSMKAYSQAGVLLGAITASYSGGTSRDRKPARWINQIQIDGSDGRKAALFNQHRRVNGRACYDTVLEHVEASGKPVQTYKYHCGNTKHYYDTPYIYHMGGQSKCLLGTVYDTKTKKVLRQTAPVGPNGEMCPIAQYEYQNDHTIVHDGENQKIVLRFNGDKRITATEKYEKNRLVSVERNEWNSSNGNLIKRHIEDGSGHSLQVREYLYDKNHNVIEERRGDGKSCDTIYRTFSEDGFNLKLTESDRSGKLIKYAYVPGTNLLATELTYDNGCLCKRLSHHYDSQIGSFCSKTIVDDGTNDDPNDLTGVSFRKIIETIPKPSLPCVGLPEEIREKTIDAFGNEILLKTIHYTYHPSGKIAREDHYDAESVQCYSIFNEYDSQERLVATTDALGNRATFAYDANFNIISQEGPRLDMRKEWIYDLANRPTEERLLQSDGTTLVLGKKYDKCSRLVTETDLSGYETHYEYNSQGQLTSVIHPDGAIKKTEYDGLGNIINETDTNGCTTRNEYNFRSQRTAIYHSDGRVEFFTYNENGGTLAAHIDSNGAKTVFTYDIFDNPIKTEIYSSSNELLKTQTATYSACCKLSETDCEGVTTFYSYDLAGRKIAEQILDREVRYTYDSQGRVYKTQQGDTSHIEEFDHLGQTIEKRTEDLDGTIIRQEKYQYDPSGNRTHLITSKGVTETLYDHQNKPIKIIDPLGATTTTDNNYQDGLTITITDPKGIQTILHHNPRGWETEKLTQNPQGAILHRELTTYDSGGNPLQSTQEIYKGTEFSHTITNKWSYGPGNRIEKLLESDLKGTKYLYDACGRLKTLIKPSKTQIHHEYDELGRLTRYYAEDIDYHYTYDRNDRILSVYDTISETTTTRSYDEYSNLTSETLATNLTLTNSFDEQGRRTQTTLPDQSQINYTYRCDDLSQVQRKGKSYTYAQRDLEGLPTRIELPTGEIAITYDKLSRQKSYQAPGYQAKFPDDAYDTIGNLCCYTHNDQREQYTYDELSQLLSENDHNYQCDSLGNRLVKDIHTCTVNNLCQVTHDGEKEYGYDLNGNLITDGESTYAYDSLDRLIAVNKRCQTILFTYDPFHRRVAKKVYSGCWRPVTHTYLWDGENEIGTMSGTKTVELRVLGEGLGAEIGAACFIEIGRSSYVPIHDHRGSVVAMQELNSGKVVERYEYTAFGEEVSKGTLSPWRFGSKRVDDETGFVYFGRRYYSPCLGKWITPDPQGFEDGPNLYAYLHNCPMTSFDLYGLYDVFDFSYFNSRSWNDFRQHVGQPKYDYFFESSFPNKSYAYDLNSSLGYRWPELENGKILFVNGMLTDQKSVLDHGMYLADMAGFNIYGVHNETHGFFNDLRESHLGGNRNTLTNPTFELERQITSYLGEGENNELLLILHSQGGILGKNALSMIPEEMQNRVSVLAIAPAAYIPDGWCKDVEHYASKRDVVPLADRRGRAQYQHTITTLKPHKDARFWDHGFQSPTYEKVIREGIRDFIKSLEKKR